MSMKELTYLAVIEPNGMGGYGVYYPDFPGCGSYGDTFQEAIANGREALELHIYGMQEDGEEIPDPSDVTSFSKEDLEGNIVTAITVYPERMKQIIENKRVKVNCTIPLWIKKAGEEARINFSRVLEEALVEKIGLNVRL